MRHFLGAHPLHARKAGGAQVQAVQQRLAAAQQGGRLHQVHLVDQAGPQALAHGGGAAADAHVLVAGGGAGLGQRGLDAVGHKVEDRAALHHQRRARMVRQHEHRHMAGRRVAPLALP
jgi:hypothetical protein